MAQIIFVATAACYYFCIKIGSSFSIFLLYMFLALF